MSYCSRIFFCSRIKMTCHVQTYSIAEICLKCHCCCFLKGVLCVCLGIKKSTKLQMSKSTPKGDI